MMAKVEKLLTYRLVLGKMGSNGILEFRTLSLFM